MPHGASIRGFYSRQPLDSVSPTPVASPSVSSRAHQLNKLHREVEPADLLVQVGDHLLLLISDHLERLEDVCALLIATCPNRRELCRRPALRRVAELPSVPSRVDTPPFIMLYSPNVTLSPCS